MAGKSVFEFHDYKGFFEEAALQRRVFERGFRSKLAEFIGTQSSFVSNVLNGDSHFSSEQIIRASKFLNLKQEEAKYLYTLLQYARAGSPELKTFLRAELDSLREDYLNIKKRVGDSKALSESDQAVYYSSWNYTAVHLITTIQEFRTIDKISSALKLSSTSVRKILMFLTEKGILTEKNGIFEPGSVLIHLNRESPLIRQHHTNCRMAAIQSLSNDELTDLHYSTISTLAASDIEKLRSQMVDLISTYVETVKPSPEEDMVCFSLDFFRLLKRA